MTLAGVSAVLVAFAALVGAIGGVVGYVLKVKEERRLRQSMRAELDVKLSKLFAELMPLANARGESIVSEAAVSHLVQRGAVDGGEECSLNAAVVTIPVGVPTQAAAISVIGQLGADHSVLRRPARDALESLRFVDAVPDLKNARLYALSRVTP
jgi:hypothetical protein